MVADTPLRSAAEKVAADVYEQVRQAVYEAAREGAAQALREVTGLEIAAEDVNLEDRMIRTEAARRLGVTQQTLIRLEKKGELASERTADGRVYVSLDEAKDALAGRRVRTHANLQRAAQSR